MFHEGGTDAMKCEWTIKDSKRIGATDSRMNIDAITKLLLVTRAGTTPCHRIVHIPRVTRLVTLSLFVRATCK